jgi:hypothetical protein
MMPRRTAAALFLGLFAALLVGSAGHDHFRHETATAASCVFCGAALATSPSAPAPLRPPPFPRKHEVVPPFAPERRYSLQLDHSGGAPPAA